VARKGCSGDGVKSKPFSKKKTGVVQRRRMSQARVPPFRWCREIGRAHAAGPPQKQRWEFSFEGPEKPKGGSDTDLPAPKKEGTESFGKEGFGAQK